jgi:DNA mismatch endonuclease (patch repair protein)
MADTRTKTQRSHIMASVRAKDTGPEMAVRRALHAMGYRYRLHAKALQGKPDIVFARLRKVIFVHGCFWHGHACRFGALPKSRRRYWHAKISGNRLRDRKALGLLRSAGWRCLVVWQCELKNPLSAQARIVAFLE